MTRDVHTNALAAAASEAVTAVTLVELQFGAGTLYANNSPVNIPYGGNTYLGVGKLGAIAEIEESTDTAASTMTLSLVGIDTTLVSAALNEDYKNREAIISTAFLNAQDAVLGAPAVVFRGRMDSMALEIGDVANISLSIVNRLSDWERTRNGRYTNEEQQSNYPGDKGLEFMVQAVEKELFWGREDPQGQGGSGSHGGDEGQRGHR
jgi:hypothetical protein